MRRQPEFVKDAGYSWVVLIGAFFCQMIALGVLLCFGIYIVVLIEHFKCTKREAATVGAIGYSMLCLLGPIAGASYRKYGCRLVIQTGGLLSSAGLFASYFVTDLYQLYFTFFVVGVGFGLVYSSSVGVLPDYFDKYRYFATSFATVGSAAGTFVFSPLFYALIDRYTWRGSMLINSGIVLHVVVLGTLMKSRTVQKNASLIDMFEIHLFKDFRFLFLFVDGIVVGGGAFIGFGMANQLAISHGVGKRDSTLLVSVMGLCNVIGRFSSAIISHFSCTNRVLYFAIVGALCGLFACVSSLCDEFWSLALTLGLFGSFFGAKVSQLASTNMELFGAKKLITTIGYSMFSFGIGGLGLPLLAGYIADNSKIENAYIMTGGLMLATFILLLFVVVMGMRNRSHSDCIPTTFVAQNDTVVINSLLETRTEIDEKLLPSILMESR